MLKRRHINGDPGGRAKRLLPAVAELVRWPFERVAWAFERGLVWPLRERLAGWAPPARGAGAAALGAIVGVAVLAGILLLPGGGEAPRERVAKPTRVAIATPHPAPVKAKPEAPVLQGATPDFSVGDGAAVAKSTGDDAAAGGSAAAPQAEAAADGEAAPAAAGAAATTSSRKPVPAGPAAMKVARRFSEAFVFYEIGKRRERARTVFGETATPRLAEALGERPPRLPADAEVPKAKVVNLVPGPRAGKAYTVSVSLLRVGLTTELRLELNKKQGAWVVTDVRG